MGQHEKSKPRMVVIEADKWGRGETGGYLLDMNTGNFCALGFLLHQEGVPKHAMADKCAIHDLEVGKVPQRVLEYRDGLSEVPDINDDDLYDPEDVEERGYATDEDRVTALNRVMAASKLPWRFVLKKEEAGRTSHEEPTACENDRKRIEGR